MTTKLSTRSTARAGVHAVGLIFEEKIGWIFREQPTDDYGIDAHVEIVDRQPTGQLLGIQIKSGASYFSEKTASGYVFRGESRHREYWLRHALPVIVVLRDPVTERAFWQVVSEENTELTATGWRMEIPFIQELSGKSAVDLLRLVTPSLADRRRAALALARPWMELARSDQRLVLCAEEWINKTSGRGSFELATVDEGTGQLNTVAQWPFVMLPGQPYILLFQQLFPWASLSIDDEYYYDYDLEGFKQSWAMYDSEEDRYIYDHDDFSQWRTSLSRVRPYQVVSGEVAEFRLEMRLNELGAAFLTLDDFLSSGRIPSEARLSGADHTGYFTGLKALALRYGVASAEEED